MQRNMGTISNSESIQHSSNSRRRAEHNIHNGEEQTVVINDKHELLSEHDNTDDVTCGLWCLKGAFLQRFANQTTYSIVFGLVGIMFAMVYSYFNGIISTLEKRFKISSETIGIISMAKDISQMLVSPVLCYYAGRRHRPRWIGCGLFAIVIYCLMDGSLHLFYGPGKEALDLTKEYGPKHTTALLPETDDSNELCGPKSDDGDCNLGQAYLVPQIVLFVARLISGIGGALYYTLGVAYLDDNTRKSSTPVLLSIAMFLGFLGPAIGYALAALCLSYFIAPNLTPIISNDDPRWMGAWWMGYIPLALLFCVCSIVYSMFPKILPKSPTAERRRITDRPNGEQTSGIVDTTDGNDDTDNKSLRDMFRTFCRILSNKVYMCNIFARIFYFIGFTPYLMFTPKYMEIQYRQSATTSNLANSIAPLVSSSFGVLLYGLLVAKYKPRSRYMAAWNLFVCLVTMIGFISYAFIGCAENQNSIVVNLETNTTTCNSDCDCDYVRFSPICGSNNKTYISPCHAGCRKEEVDVNGHKKFLDCSCIAGSSNSVTSWLESAKLANANFTTDGVAVPGACPVNCFNQFIVFVIISSVLNFMGATGHVPNVLFTTRSVLEKDKNASMGLGLMLICLLTFIPSPIFFGWLFDNYCLVWGKTCTNKGNCWLYDAASLRFNLNIIASSFLFVGAIFDCGLWYYCKDIKMFDEEDQHEVNGHINPALDPDI